MRTITATEAKNRLGEALAALESDSLLIERNGKPAALAFPVEDGVKMVLSAYAHGTISRSNAMRMLGYRWYGQLIDALSASGIDRPSTPKGQRDQMSSLMAKAFKATK
jgi:hypothetical protein